MKHCCQSEKCSHWIVLPMLVNGKKTPEMIGHCTDWFDTQLKWDNNRIQVGQQQAIESFRNELVESMEKPNFGVLALIELLAGEIEKKRIIFEYETRKQIRETEGDITP